MNQLFIKLTSYVPGEALALLFTLLLSFLIGLEREAEAKEKKKGINFGGVRTYPLIGVSGHILILIGKDTLFPFIAGMLVIGSLLVVFYRQKIRKGREGFTTELSGFLTYLIGGLVARELMWVAVAITVVMVLLLRGKVALGSLLNHVSTYEINVFSKFMLLTAVILPILPNEVFTPIQLNPFKAWLVVVAVSSISYISYLIQLFTKNKGGLLMTSILGGVYSSTVTTVVLAKQSRQEYGVQSMTKGINPYAVAMLIASSIMYIRILILVAIFNLELFFSLLHPLLPTIILGFLLVGLFFIIHRSAFMSVSQQPKETKNPLEINVALVFAVLFVAVKTLNHLALEYYGGTGIYSLAFIMGFTDVDPFILSMTEDSGLLTLPTATLAIIIAASSNNLLKGIYAMLFATRKIGCQALFLLILLSSISLISYYLYY